ncbi:MAG: methyltransferase [Pseudomonadota bacterium]
MRHAERKAGLEALLLRFQPLWRPQPFKIETPDWCGRHPALTHALLGLDDAHVGALETDTQALIAWLTPHLPDLAELTRLITFPAPVARGETAGEAGRLFTDIPGRKQAQIVAYAAALGAPRAPLLEWCAGKGHLGRLLAHRWHWPVTSLEIDPALCAGGEALARRAQVDCMQHFVTADALADGSDRHLAGRHAIALHACGDLHTHLIRHAVARHSPALDLAPCCYYRTTGETYRAFNPTDLTLNHDDLRLAVTETVTASARQRQRSRQALAWKLGWVEWRKAVTGESGYRSFPPVPESWLRGDFPTFIERMKTRCLPAPPTPFPEGAGCAAEQDPPGGRSAQSKCSPELHEGWATVPQGQASPPLARYEALGQSRAQRMLRLQLPRLAFRRALETWLVMDMAVYLETHGYAVEVTEFCPAALTPRNLLLSARRYNPETSPKDRP